MPDPVNAHTLMATLRAQLDLLNTVLNECAIECVIYDVPLYEDGRVPDEIVPAKIKGKKAVKIASRALRNLSRPEDQDPGSVWRAPGVLRVDKDLSKTVENINSVKTELKTYIQELYPSARARNTFYKREFPGRVMLQVYRKIYFVKKPVDKIRFTWSPFTESTRSLTRQDALDMLIKRSKGGIDHIDKHRFTALKMATDYVRNCSRDSEFVIRKPRSPYPIAAVYVPESTKPETIPSSLPLIIGPQDDFDIGELPVYDQEKRRRTRSDKMQTEPIFAPLYLHQRLV